jgi:Fe-Mn family superoxide dismutase
MESVETKIAKFDLPYLPFGFDALEPHISKETMQVHYNKHHRGYVRKLNQAVEGSDLSDYSLEELVKNASKFKDAVRNNAGGHYNHTLFWRILTPDNIKPYGKLLSQIEAAFNSFDSFKEEFSRTAATHFGSGWAWLGLSDKNTLEIGSTPNQDNPLMDVSYLQGYPLLGIDLWEHAYYLDYQNRKGEYIDAFWQVLDWTEVSNRYEEARLINNS